jgi:hypothetical protein
MTTVTTITVALAGAAAGDPIEPEMRVVRNTGEARSIPTDLRDRRQPVRSPYIADYILPNGIPRTRVAQAPRTAPQAVSPLPTVDGRSIETVVTAAIKGGRDQLRWVTNLYTVLTMLDPETHAEVFAATGVPADGRRNAKPERVFVIEIRDSKAARSSAIGSSA